jgi:phage gpG-like protein
MRPGLGFCFRGGLVVRVTVTGGDLPGLKALAQRMKEASRSVLVGVPAGEFEESPEGAVPMAMVAAVHEFGCPEKNIPERSFLRGGIRRGAPKFQRLNAANLRAIVLGGKTVAEALGQLGAVAAGEVKREFTAGTFAPNKPATIARKGSSRPLIDTGSLRQSITWQLEGSESSHARIVR